MSQFQEEEILYKNRAYEALSKCKEMDKSKVQLRITKTFFIMVEKDRIATPEQRKDLIERTKAKYNLR